MDSAPLLPLPDPSVPFLRDRVRALFRWAALRDPDLEGALLAGSEGLREALDWTVRGTSADETACVWLEDLRWARALGLDLEEGAPVPPVAWWESALEPVPTGWSGRHPRLAAQLRAAQMQYPARHREPVLTDDSFFPRLAPLAAYPQASASHLGQLAINLTALTHASPEALACGVVWTLLARWRLCEAPVGAQREPGVAAPDPGSAGGPAAREGLSGDLERLRRAVGLAGDAPEPSSSASSASASPASAPASPSLMATMAATGSSWDRVAALVRAAPHTVRALRDPRALVEHPEEAPGCVVFLAGELAGDPDGILAAPGVLAGTAESLQPTEGTDGTPADDAVARAASAWLESLDAWQKVRGRHAGSPSEDGGPQDRLAP